LLAIARQNATPCVDFKGKKIIQSMLSKLTEVGMQMQKAFHKTWIRILLLPKAPTPHLY
jgi:hypothetical protein